MISASDNFNIALAESSRNFKASICINGSEIDGDIQLVDVFRGTGSESILFGAVYIPYFTAKIANLNTDLQDAEVTLRIGVRLPGGSYDYIPLGNYHIVEIANAQGLCSIKGMGSAFCKLEGKNIPTTGSNSPKTLLQDIRDLANVTILSDFSNERLDRNVRIAIKSRLEPHSCKEVLGIVAALMGGFVTENASGSIVLKEYASGSTISIPADRFLTPPTINNNYYEITGVKCIIHDNPDNQYDPDSRSKGTVNYTFRNKYMSEGLFDDMADTAIGLRYYPGQFSISLGDPRIDPWDILSVTDTDGVSRTVYPMQTHHHIDGGLSTEIDAQMSTTGDMGSGTATQTITIGSYDELLGKPSINDVILSGNQTFEDLGLYDDPAFASTVAELTTDKADDTDVVHISGAETITGAKTFSSLITGTATRSQSIPIGQVSSVTGDAGAKVFAATVDGITELRNGVCLYLRNGDTASTSGWTLNINELGAKPVYNSMSNAAITNQYAANSTYLFVYNENRISGGCWDLYYGYDSNNNTIGYQIRTNSKALPVTVPLGRYRLMFTSADGTHYVPATTSTSTNATAIRDVTQTPIDPFGEIVYYGTTSILQKQDAMPSTTVLWQQYAIALGYSFNRAGSALNLTPWKAVYLKCAPQSNGSAIIDATTPYTQTLPSNDDGKIYIFLGVAYSATNIELMCEHPVYYYKNGKIRQWTNCTSDEIVAMTDAEILEICQ